MSTQQFLKDFCQTPGQVFRLGVYFVLPLSQEEEDEEQQQEPQLHLPEFCDLETKKKTRLITMKSKPNYVEFVLL